MPQRLVLQPNGVTFNGRRADNELDREFLASTDRWFRPVQVRTGPDGAIWVVDMYRYVIEHPRWIPQATLAEIDVYAGQGQLQALCTLDGLDALTPDDVLHALKSDHPEVVRHAIRLSERMLDDAGVLTAVQQLATNTNPRIQRQVAYSLGECKGAVV